MEGESVGESLSERVCRRSLSECALIHGQWVAVQSESLQGKGGRMAQECVIE